MDQPEIEACLARLKQKTDGMHELMGRLLGDRWTRQMQDNLISDGRVEEPQRDNDRIDGRFGT